MKRVLFFFLSLFLICESYPQSGWQQLPINLNHSVCDIQFLNPGTGFAAAGRNFAPGSIWKTTNGGSSWFPVFDTPGYMKALSFTDVNIGTIVGFKTNLRKTLDGGNSWKTFDLNDPHSLNGVYFLNSVTGWIVGESNIIYRTIDNGSSWVGKHSGSSDVTWRDVYFFDYNTGIIVGESTSRSRIIRTNDSGEHWLETFTPEGNWLRLSFHGNTGYAAGSGSLTGLIKTTNRGETWNFTGEFNGLKDVYCLDASVAYVTGENGLIYKTTDAGSSWQFQNSGVTAALYGIYFINQNTGWACGDNGTIIKTTNGGNPISVQQIGSEVPGSFALYQNYPNPFNPTTKIRFDIPPVEAAEGSLVSLDIYDLLGREAASLVNENLSPGTYEVEFDASNLPSGIYFYRLEAGDFVESMKMVLLK